MAMCDCDNPKGKYKHFKDSVIIKNHLNPTFPYSSMCLDISVERVKFLYIFKEFNRETNYGFIYLASFIFQLND